MVRAAEPDFIPVKVDEANHVARGLFQAGAIAARRARLSYESTRQDIRFSLQFQPVQPDEEAQNFLRSKLQAASRFARFDSDPDYGLLTLNATSTCSTSQDPEWTVHQLVEDLEQVIGDDRFGELIA
jgi:hypothetical protein